MNKKFITTALSALLLSSSAHASATTKSDTQKLIKYSLLGAGVGIIAIVPPVAILISKAIKNPDSANTTTKATTPESECNIKSWKDVADLYLKAAEKEKNSKGETAEYYEHLGDYYRCLFKFDEKNEILPTHNDGKAADNFYNASKAYSERAKQFESDKTSYGYQINSAKAAEMNAKYNEYLIPMSMCYDPSTHRIYNADNKNKRCAEAWADLIGKKPSYDAYANAKRLEYCSYSNPEIVAEAWEKVKNDQALKDSFFYTNSWEAYQAFAEANRQEWLFKCDKCNKQAVYEAWIETYKKDKICAKSGAIIYEAFAAEAYQNAQDALQMEK
ncbi:MAG: hypothetical protein Q4D57_02275 [Clostridia bacterium]|nr:hypothetical protein [Clostridia bacterium]